MIDVVHFFFYYVMRITLWLRLPSGLHCALVLSVRLGLWNLALVLYDGFGGVEEG